MDHVIIRCSRLKLVSGLVRLDSSYFVLNGHDGVKNNGRFALISIEGSRSC